MGQGTPGLLPMFSESPRLLLEPVGDSDLKDAAGAEAGAKCLARHAGAGWDDLALWECPSEI